MRALALIVAAVVAGCSGAPSGVDGGEGADLAAPLPPDDLGVAPTPDGGPLVLAVIGDYGVCGDTSGMYVTTCAHEQAVAALVHGWQPAAILTTGDNSYGSGSTAQLPGDQAPYDDYIKTRQAFFPSFGNHDWLAPPDMQGLKYLQPSLTYFGRSAPYYAQSFGSLVTFYLLDTNDADPDGDGAGSTQAAWFAAALARSQTTWNVVINHQAPYSACGEGSYPQFRWIAPAKVDLVLSGHSHVYERFDAPHADSDLGLPYVVIGASGAPLQGSCGTTLPGQQQGLYGVFGALRIEVDGGRLAAIFVDEQGIERDRVTLLR